MHSVLLSCVYCRRYWLSSLREPRGHVRKNKRVCAIALLEIAEKERSPKEERLNDRVFVWVSVRASEQASERKRDRERGYSSRGREGLTNMARG
jgi:hypothetical protein